MNGILIVNEYYFAKKIMHLLYKTEINTSQFAWLDLMFTNWEVMLYNKIEMVNCNKKLLIYWNAMCKLWQKKSNNNSNNNEFYINCDKMDKVPTLK